MSHAVLACYRMLCGVMGAEGWTAAEELALADHTKRMGMGAWEELSDMVRGTREESGRRFCVYRTGFLLIRAGFVL